jgi:hypothetical protein
LVAKSLEGIDGKKLIGDLDLLQTENIRLSVVHPVQNRF